MLSRSPVPVLLLAALLLGPGRARADLDAEVEKPYRLRVVLDVANNRLLTPVFIDQLGSDLRDILQTELGDLAQVEVVHKHPLLKEVHAKGLEKALDGYTRISDVKTHFVRIDFAAGRYEIQARQHDGLTGLASPVVRGVETTDRELVARTAAQLVNRDFGLVGTVTRVAGSRVDVAIKGAGLGVPLERWVGVNEVFAVAQISRGSRGLRSVRLQWAVLQVKKAPQDGVCVCQFYHRFKHDTLGSQPGVLGYRCLKLGTVRGPLRLRLLDFKTHTPHDSLQVHVSATGFDERSKKLATDRDGMVPRTEETYGHVAFVRVLSGGKVRAQLPVAMLSDRTVDCLVSISAEAEAAGEKDLRRERWMRRIYDSLRAAADRVTELNELGKKSLRRDAFEKGKEGLESLNADLKSLTAERDRLRQEGGLDLSEGEQRLEDLQKRQKELKRFVTRLGKIVKDEKDPKRLEMLGMVERARLLETQAEFGEALELYEKVLNQFPKEVNIRKRFGALDKAWNVRQNKEHIAARDYIYKTWPKLTDPAALQKGLKEVRAAFAVCRKYDDRLSPQKILRANVSHADNLKKRLGTLRPQAREDDRKEAETIAEVATELKKLHEEVAAYLKENKPAFP